VPAVSQLAIVIRRFGISIASVLILWFITRGLMLSLRFL
jgi:hypothetical protein